MGDLGNLLNPQSNGSAIAPPGAGHTLLTQLSGDIRPPTRFYAHYLSYKNVHEPHAQCPSSLACLIDTDGYPAYSHEVLIRCAILGSAEANQQLPLYEILAALKGKYPFFRSEEAGQTLEQSVMMTFSLSPHFVKNTDNTGEVVWAVSNGAPAMHQAPNLAMPPSPFNFPTPAHTDPQLLSPQTPAVPQVHPDMVLSPSFAYREHPPHDDCPSALSCLSDTVDRPAYTYPILIRCAILGSPHRRLEIREIYQVLADKFAFFKLEDKTWKQSVRHCLSLHAAFVPTKRPVGAPGWGSWWTFDEGASGTKRPRKRGGRAAAGEGAAASAHDAPLARGTGADAGVPLHDDGSLTGTDGEQDAEGEIDESAR